MTEAEAEADVRRRVDPAAFARIDRFRALVVAEADRQNLVARSTLAAIWNRHLLDSLQLRAFAPASGLWLDIGSGAGFPGIVIAAADPSRPVLLVEPRRLRAEFLRRAADALDLPNVEILQTRIEMVCRTAAAISARAVASASPLVAAARSCASPTTVWLLPAGRAALMPDIDGMTFHVEQSVTDPGSVVLVGKGRPC